MAQEQGPRRIIAGAAVVLWLAGAGWVQFSDVSPRHHGTAEVQAQLEKCQGSFAERYACKEKIIIESNRRTFNLLMTKLAIVVLPPLALAGAYSLHRHRAHRKRHSRH